MKNPIILSNSENHHPKTVNHIKKLEKGKYCQNFPTLNSSQWSSHNILQIGTPNYLSWGAKVSWKHEKPYHFVKFREPSPKNCKPHQKVRKRHVWPEFPYSQPFSIVELQYLANRYPKLSLMGSRGQLEAQKTYHFCKFREPSPKNCKPH